MSIFSETEAVVGRSSSKQVVSKILQITQEKHLPWSLLLIKSLAFRSAALVKRDCNTGALSRNSQTKNQRMPLLQNTSDGSFWRKAKYDISLTVRGQLQCSRTKTEGITLNKKITIPDQVEIIKTFRDEKGKSIPNA